MGKKIFVGGLKWEINTDVLRREFEQFGEIAEVSVVTDRETGRSRGFGFVTYVEEESAKQAVQEMNGKDLMGRTVKVDFAQDTPRDSRRPPRRSNGGYGERRYSDDE